MSEARQRNQPGMPAPGQDYVAMTGVTPEQRAEIDVAAIAAEKATQAASQESTGSTAKEVASAMAAAMIELVGVASGGGRKAIAPQVLKERQEAWDEMEALLADLKRRGEKPVYELTAPLFDDDVLYEPTFKDGAGQSPRRIRFPKIPNEGMIPKDANARQVMALYLRAIGGKTPDLAETSYQAYLNRPRAVEVVGEPQHQPILGSPGSRSESSVEILENTPLEERTYIGPKKILGTVQPEIPGAI